MPTTRVQIFGNEHYDDAMAVAAAGADHLGFRLKEDPVLDGAERCISASECRSIMTDLPDHVVTIVLFATPDEALILRLADATHPHMVQTCWPTDAIGPDRERRLREKLNLNGIAVIKEIPVGGPDSRAQALAAAQRYEHGADSLILDTFKDPRWIGATGEVHDWSISRTIVQLVDCPCILAGGLADDNVEQALAAVEPWGVDSYTRTNLPDGRKDIEKVRALVAAVRQFDAARRPLRSGE